MKKTRKTMVYSISKDDRLRSILLLNKLIQPPEFLFTDPDLLLDIAVCVDPTLLERNYPEEELEECNHINLLGMKLQGCIACISPSLALKLGPERAYAWAKIEEALEKWKYADNTALKYPPDVFAKLNSDAEQKKATVKHRRKVS